MLRELDRLTRDVETFGPVAGQVIEVIAEVRSLAEDVMEMRREDRDEREKALRAEREARGMSTTLKAAIIAGIFGLLGTIALVIGQIVSSG